MRNRGGLLIGFVLAAAIALSVASACSQTATPPSTSGTSSAPTTPSAPATATVPATMTAVPSGVVTEPARAIQLLQAGNARYVTGFSINQDVGAARKQDLVPLQTPFAVILSCSDSRVPPEILFDQSLGNLFVVRDAGNVIDPAVLGSVQYGVDRLRAPLVVVVGHEGCSTVGTALGATPVPFAISSVLDQIRPAIRTARSTATTGEALFNATVQQNAQNSAAQVRNSALLAPLVKSGKLQVVAAEYSANSGVVTWLPAPK